ncbi:MAG: EVE domain-containing protein [Planctomycetota bacterium]
MDAASYWLLKTEPETYSIDDLARQRRGVWDGVRNRQARNLLRDRMRVGDGVLVYHSSCRPPGVAGLARVASTARPDASAFDSKSPYFDAKSVREKPTWFSVEIEFVEKFPALVTLDALRADRRLRSLMCIKPGQRLSVQPVTSDDYACIVELGRTPAS